MAIDGLSIADSAADRQLRISMDNGQCVVRPTVNRQFINRQFINRQFINRQFLNRQFINRQFANRQSPVVNRQ
ncbi:MAG: hypothetical protein DMF86_23555 [Acidobacteria bacterium]|nr:MAG: hypothetical protein DMF86_23555 [Acidobacteriota bacterium]